jgi:hypothetical protein
VGSQATGMDGPRVPGRGKAHRIQRLMIVAAAVAVIVTQLGGEGLKPQGSLRQ